MKGKGEPFKAVKDDPRLISEETYQGRFKKMLSQLQEKGIVKNQSDLAKQLGYNSTYLSVIANKRERVPANFIEKLKTLDSTIDGEWLLNNPASANTADEQQQVIDAVNALPETSEAPAEKPQAEPKQKKKPGRKPGRKPAAAKEAKAAEVPAPKAEKAPAPKAEKAPKAEPQQEETNILHPIDELLLQNRLLISEIKKQGERVDTVLEILKAKI